MAVAEMLAWGALYRFGAFSCVQQCNGILTSASSESALLETLELPMRRMGFSQPIQTGPYCALYERPGAVLICSSSLGKKPVTIQAFTLAGPDPGTLQQTLGVLALEAGIEIQVDKWMPPLD
jgi:hypothetical protein